MELPLKLERESIDGKGVREETSSEKINLVADKFYGTRKCTSMKQIENRKYDQFISRTCFERVIFTITEVCTNSKKTNKTP